MKTRIRDSIASLLVSAALLGATLMIAGCPAPIEDPGEQGGGGGGGGGGGSKQEYDILLEKVPTNGNVEINPTSKRAAEGDTVTITLKPNPGYEPENLSVIMTGNYPLTSVTRPTPLPTGGYSSTFVMPASLVRISVDFTLLTTALINAHNKISVLSSWEDIYDLNELIKKVQSQSPSQATITNTVIKNLVANSAAAESIPSIITSSALNPAATLGILPAKMQIEDLTKWLALEYPSYPMDKAVASGTSSDGTIKYNNRTHVYYVKEDNPTIPLVDLKKGWEQSLPFPITGSVANGDPVDLDGIQEITLSYKVGTNPQYTFIYQMWLWPSAQYTIQYEPGATGAVTIQDFYVERPTGTTQTAANPITISPTTPERDGEQTLSTGTPQRTGQVGKIPTPPSSGTPTYDRAVFTVIKPSQLSQTGILVHVTTISGSYVTNVISGSALTTSNNTVSGSQILIIGAPGTKPLNDVTSTTPGAFYPESRKYLIRVWPRTPPSAIPSGTTPP